ncbi:DUF3592 domain-containing protein [Candidatus Nanohalobium constans]|uniref:DUF3592 domain-containing protein n=1 Tax=Candidatus Nanohalobium constans TaxID=2565781 RepID=A0A5Q0UG29_9ARCH|nr:DUF3592 domain-containing protein [Candidatus Nanohalobium constans]QGA80603.1 hypothetical protein LC1Nh_0714 [Candidatus Nanohalobium constans]
MGLDVNVGGKNSNSLSPNQVLLFSSIFMILGLAIAGYGFMQYQGQSENVDKAVNITATVTDTNIRTDSSRRGGVDYQAEISFEYSFEGENYSSDFIHPLDRDKEFNQETEAEKFIENYPAGEKVDASVNPEKPGEAFLIAERSDQPLLFMIIGGFMVMLGAYKTTRSFI